VRTCLTPWNSRRAHLCRSCSWPCFVIPDLSLHPGNTRHDPGNTRRVLLYNGTTTHLICEQVLSSSWDGRPFGHNRHGPKRGGVDPHLGVGGLGLHLTQCGVHRGLSLYEVASWSIQPFSSNRHGPNIGVWLCPHFSWGKGELRYHLTQCDRGRGLPPCQVTPSSIQPFGHSTPKLQTDRQDNGPIAYGEPFFKRSPRNRLLNGPLDATVSHDMRFYFRLSLRCVTFGSRSFVEPVVLVSESGDG